MRMKTLSLVMGAALGASAMQVSADSLLAPYFQVRSGGGIQTWFALKTSGNEVVNAGQFGYPQPNPALGNLALHNLHYYYLYKNMPVDTGTGWGKTPFEANQTKNCTVEDAYGKASSYDMLYHDIAGNKLPPGDQSGPPFFGIDNVEGFVIIAEEDDAQNLIGPEGGFSGFGYVVNVQGNHLIEYKMLNDAASTDPNVWTDTAIAKTAFTMSWWPVSTYTTYWPTIVLGNNVVAGPTWGGAVTLLGAANATGVIAGNTSTNDTLQVYNNDEKLISSQTPKRIVCAGWVQRNEIMTANAELNTRNGGWGFYQVRLENDNFCDPANQTCPAVPNNSTGALMQKYELQFAANPADQAVGWTIETSGIADPSNTPY